jgi:hypothetical protein
LLIVTSDNEDDDAPLKKKKTEEDDDFYSTANEKFPDSSTLPFSREGIVFEDKDIVVTHKSKRTETEFYIYDAKSLLQISHRVNFYYVGHVYN